MLDNLLTNEAVTKLMGCLKQRSQKRKQAIAALLNLDDIHVCEVKRQRGFSMLTIQVMPQGQALTICYSPRSRKVQGYQLNFPF